MNSGIQDAHNLAWKLARVLAGADVESLLTSYESERRESVLKSVDRYTDVLTRLRNWRTRVCSQGDRYVGKFGPSPRAPFFDCAEDGDGGC